MGKVLIALLSLLIIISCSSEEPESSTPENVMPLFTKLDYTNTGVNFANIIQDKPNMNVILYEYFHNGAGVAAGDLDNDGLSDLYFVGNFGKNHLYKNLGNFKFEDITESSNTAGSFGWSTGVCFVDINSDGLLDIYLSKSGNLELENRRNQLLVNKGNMRFVDEAKEYGLDDPGYSNQAAFFDYDRDGDLDAYVMNHPVMFESERLNNKLNPMHNNQRLQYGSDHLYEKSRW